MTIDTDKQGMGYGSELMKKFLQCPDAKKAELIFLDPVPGYGSNSGRRDETTQVDSLKRFYRRFGFHTNPQSSRMWLVRVGKLSDSELPT